MFVFLNGNKFTLGDTSKHMTYNGCDVWITTANDKVKIARFTGFGANTLQEIDVSSYFSNPCEYITSGAGKVYVFDGKTPTEPQHDEKLITKFIIIDPASKNITRQVVLPWEAHCFPVYGANKIWFSTPASTIDTTTKQKLFYFDLSTGIFSSLITINAPTQYSARVLHYGGDAFIFTLNLNGSSITKFDAYTGAEVIEILVNRKPLTAWTNNNRDLLIGSFNGMVSTVNVSTNGVTNNYSTNGLANGIVDDDNGFVWAAQPNLVRVKKANNTDNFRIMNGQDKDYSIEAFSETVFKEILISNPYTHQYWDGDSIETKTEKQYIILLTQNSLFVAADFSDSWDLEEVRDYYVAVRGTSIIATGPNLYYGET